MIIYYISALILGAVSFKTIGQNIAKQFDHSKIIEGAPEKPRTYLLIAPLITYIFSSLDFLKGVFIALLGLLYLESFAFTVLLSLLLVLGSCLSPFLKFKGFSLAAIIGISLVLSWQITLIALILYLIILSFFPYILLSLLPTALLAAVTAIILQKHPYLIAFYLAVFVLLTIKSIPNIKNFLNKNEPNIINIYKNRNN